MVSDLIFCLVEVFTLILLCLWYTSLNIGGPYGKWILLLEYVGLVAVAYLFLLIYKIFTGN